MNQIKLASQNIQPSKIVCVGRNYSAHIAELNNEHPEQMVIFNKPNSAITNTLLSSHNGDTLHYETELCFVIKNKQLAGVGIGLDLTKRALQSSLKEKGLPWERAKAFDGSVLFSDFIELTPEMTSFIFELHIDGKVIQHGETQLMLHQPAQILAEVNEFMGLEEGDIIMTGTPAGVGMVNAGREFKVALYSDSGQQCLLEHHWSVNQS